MTVMAKLVCFPNWIRGLIFWELDYLCAISNRAIYYKVILPVRHQWLVSWNPGVGPCDLGCMPGIFNPEWSSGH